MTNENVKVYDNLDDIKMLIDDNNYPICKYPTPFKSKPIDNSSIGTYYNDADKLYQIVDNDYLISIIESGYTIKPHFFNEYSNAGYAFSNLLFLDFDHDSNPIDIINKLKSLELYPLIGYYSFNHKQDFKKFRFVFKTVTIFNANKYESMYDQLIKIIGKELIKIEIKNQQDIKNGKYYTSKNNYEIVKYTPVNNIPYYDKLDYIVDTSCKSPSKFFHGSNQKVFYTVNARPTHIAHWWGQ